MRIRVISMPLIAALIVAGVVLTGCDGEGLFVAQERRSFPDSGDQPPVPGIPTPPDNGNGDPSAPTPAVFGGVWMAAFGNDFPTDSGQRQYAARLNLQQTGSSITGSGRIWRVVRTGDVAAGESNLTVSGSVDASGRDAVITTESPRTGRMRWRMRAGSDVLIGIYEGLGSDNQMERSGHAIWRRENNGEGSGSWVAGFSDDFADSASGYLARTRTATIVVNRSGNSLSGIGSFDEQRPGRLEDRSLDFQITRGLLDAPRIGFTFGSGDLRSDYDWYGYAGRNRIYTAYGQYDSNSSRLARFGHTEWLRSESSEPSAVSGRWVTAFSDTITEDGLPGADYLAVVNLSAQRNGPITGSNGQVLDEAVSDPTYQSHSVSRGNILGTRVVFDMTGNRNRFAWVLRLTNDTMVGSYQRLRDGSYAGSGTVEWRRLSNTPDLIGSTWAAAYVDTFGAFSPPATQLALVTITNQSSTSLSGNGALRYAGDTRRRLLSVNGSIRPNGEITWTWTGPDGFGRRVWNLRQAGDYLYGTYTNFTANGELEAQGHAVFIRTVRTTTFTR